MEFLHSLQPFIHWLHDNPSWAGVITFFISLGESLALVGLLVPGSVLLTAIGALIGAGVLPFWSIVIWAIVGAIAGDGLSFLIGHHYKEQIRDLWPFSRYPSLIEKGEAFFTAHGSKSVILGRFVGPVRPIIPLVAGMMNMRHRLFLISNVASGIVWAPAYMIPGMILGSATQQLAPHATSRLLVILIALVIIIWLTYWIIKFSLRIGNRYYQRWVHYCWQGICARPKWVWLKKLLQDPSAPDSHHQLSLACCIVLLAGFFGLLLHNVINEEFLTQANDVIFYITRSIYQEHVAKIIILITIFGAKQALIPIALFFTLWLAVTKHWRACFHWLLAIFFCSCAVWLFKYYIESPRPTLIADLVATNSFPSGHTTLSVTFYGMLAILLGENLKPTWRKIYYGFTVLICILIPLSRLYLGVHWLTDVVAGSALGLTIVLLCTISYRRAWRKPVASTLGIILLILVFALSWGFQVDKRFNKYLQGTKPSWPSYRMDTATWWSDAHQRIPMIRPNRLGKTGALFNIQWLSSLENINSRLTKNGWLKVSTSDLISFLNRISDTGKDAGLPIFDPLYQGQGPAAVYVKKTKHENHFLVLRLWKSNIVITDNQNPLWYGTVLYTPNNKHHFNFTFTLDNKNQEKPKQSALKTLPASIKGLEIKHIYYPGDANPHNKIPTNIWHAGCLLIKDS